MSIISTQNRIDFILSIGKSSFKTSFKTILTFVNYDYIIVIFLWLFGPQDVNLFSL